MKISGLFLLSMCCVLMLAAMPHQAAAQDDEGGFSITAECLDSNTLHEYISMNVSGTIYDVEGRTINCTYGCDSMTGKCINISSTDTNFMLIVMFGIIAFVSAYICFSFDKNRHASMQILFLAMSIYSVWNMIGIARSSLDYLAIQSFDEIINSSLTVWIWAGILVIFYLIITYIPAVFAYMKAKRKGG